MENNSQHFKSGAVNIYMHYDTLRAVDKERGLASRSAFISAILNEVLGVGIDEN